MLLRVSLIYLRMGLHITIKIRPPQLPFRESPMGSCHRDGTFSLLGPHRTCIASGASRQHSVKQGPMPIETSPDAAEVKRCAYPQMTPFLRTFHPLIRTKGLQLWHSTPPLMPAGSVVPIPSTASTPSTPVRPKSRPKSGRRWAVWIPPLPHVGIYTDGPV